MSGINMITTSVLALTPDLERRAVVPQPERGRASRCTVAGDFSYIIGVRGHEHPQTHAVAPEEEAGAFEAQLVNCFAWLGSHAGKAGASLQDLVRVDACIRDINQAGAYRAIAKDSLGGSLPFAGYAIGVPLGARLEQEIGGIAAAPGVPKEVAWDPERPDEAQAVRAGGLVFASGCSGLQDAKTGAIIPDLYADKQGQARQALRRVEAGLGRFGIGLERLLRLDVYLRDIYFEDGFVAIARDLLGTEAPSMTILGGDPEHSAEVEISAIAAA
jgi:enamine deaminase RidA (YjgF/YER057c/UK114 family)